jgi:hypothetical protein
MPTAQQHHGWSKRKTQEDRERHRNKNFPSEIERGNNNDTDGEGPEARRRNAGGVKFYPVKAASESGAPEPHSSGGLVINWLVDSI